MIARRLMRGDAMRNDDSHKASFTHSAMAGGVAARRGDHGDGANAPAFVPVFMTPSEEPRVEQSSSIEIEIGSIRIQLRGGVNGAALRTVLLAVRSVR